MKFKEYINESTLVNSDAMVVVKDNIKKTTKGGGKISVVTDGKSMLSVRGSDEFKNYFQGTFQKSGKWKIIQVKYY